MQQHRDDVAAGPAAEVSGSDLDLVEYVVISVPELSSAVAVAEALRSLVASAQIRILDLVGVVTGFDGRSTVIEADLLPGLATLEGVDGEVGGLLSEDDVVLAGSALPPGTSALSWSWRTGGRRCWRMQPGTAAAGSSAESGSHDTASSSPGDREPPDRSGGADS